MDLEAPFSSRATRRDALCELRDSRTVCTGSGWTEPARETAMGWSRTVGGEKTRMYEDSVLRPLDVATPAATSTARCTSTVSVRRSGSERGRPCSVGIQ